MRLPTGSWRALHDAKNELAAAMLLLGRMRAGAAVTPAEVEMLLRRTAVQLDELFWDVDVDEPGDIRVRPYRRYSPRRRGNVAGRLHGGRRLRNTAESRQR